MSACNGSGSCGGDATCYSCYSPVIAPNGQACESSRNGCITGMECTGAVTARKPFPYELAVPPNPTATAKQINLYNAFYEFKAGTVFASATGIKHNGCSLGEKNFVPVSDNPSGCAKNVVYGSLGDRNGVLDYTNTLAPCEAILQIDMCERYNYDNILENVKHLPGVGSDGGGGCPESN